jgi:hypothetical protein
MRLSELRANEEMSLRLSELRCLILHQAEASRLQVHPPVRLQRGVATTRTDNFASRDAIGHIPISSIGFAAELGLNCY